MTGAPYRFHHVLRVRWAECDMQGIVFNPHYMMFCDVAFTEYMRAIGLAYPQCFVELNTDLFMAAANLRFLASARYDEEIDIAMRCAYLGRSSFRMDFAVRRDGSELVDGALTYVHASRAAQASVALPDIFVTRVEAFETVRPERKQAG